MVAVASRLKVHPSTLITSPSRQSSNAKSEERVVVHIDMDSFFASVAMVNDPSLRGKCIAVCHGGGEISSCSYEARAFGVRAGMFARNARKLCPQLISVPYNFQAYEQVSIQIYSFFYDYPGVHVEAVSVDEAYLDISTTLAKHASQSTAEQLVANLRQRIQMATGCTASAGIGPSKLVARLATKSAKPDGQLRIRQEGVVAYVDTLKVDDLPGIGWRTTKKLRDLKVQTVRELRAIELSTLQREFGERQGVVFYNLARAIDVRPVEPLKPRKSIGAEASWGVRFEAHETEKAHKFISDISDEVGSRVAAAGTTAAKATFKIYRRIPNSSMEGWKHLGHGPCTVVTKSVKLPTYQGEEGSKEVLRSACIKAFVESGVRNDEFRGVGLQATDLTFGELNFDHASLPVDGTRRIDSFFAPTKQRSKKRGNSDTGHNKEWNKDTPLEEHDLLGGHTTNAVGDSDPKVHEAKLARETDTREPLRRSAVEVLEEDVREHVELAHLKRPACGTAAQADESEHVALDERIAADYVPEEIEEDRIEEIAEELVPRCEARLSEIPEGWDRGVFESLPKGLQAELLRNSSRFLISEQGNGQSDSETEGSESNEVPATRRRKRNQDSLHNTVRHIASKKPRRRQAAQVTMTQFADIAELRDKGNEVLDAEEFRARPLREVVELLQDLKPTKRRMSMPRMSKSAGGDLGLISNSSNPLRRQNISRRGRDGDAEATLDIPSPPSLSSDSDSSCGIADAVEREGLDQDQIYVREELDDYASNLKLWMAVNASNIKTGHVELLRGRLVEFVQLKQLDAVCAELRTIRKFVEEDNLAPWHKVFNSLLHDVQDETERAYGFKLAIRPLEPH